MSRPDDVGPCDEHRRNQDGVTIGEASLLLGVGIDAIRYYEREGLVLEKPTRDGAGWRRYTERDLAWFRGLIMLRGTGMTVSEMQVYAAAYRDGASPKDRLELLKAHRARVVERIDETRRHLAALDRKIERYEGSITERGRTGEHTTS